jgi:tetratricopeptide (TPR) repeat protein
MDPIRGLLDRLKETKGDSRAQAVVTAEFLVISRPEADRDRIREAVDAAAVLRWFDPDLLGEMLQIPREDAQARFDRLKIFSFIGHYRRGKNEVHNLHESTRLGWRAKIARENTERFRVLCLRASSCFAGDATPAGRIEWIYHLLCGDPSVGASELEKLDRHWTASARPEDRHALATALRELDDSHLIDGRARAWCLLSIARTRHTRGESAQLESISQEALTLARQCGDNAAEAAATCLVGTAWQAQGKLDAARAAFGDYLAISRRLVEQEPSNSDWQQDVAAALRRLGDVLQAQNKLEAAGKAFHQTLAICRRLAEQDPSNAGWQRDLATAHRRVGNLLQAEGNLEASRIAFEESLAICRRQAEQHPSNADWQRDLASAHGYIGEVLWSQGKLETARGAFDETLAITRRLAEKDPSNADWQRNLARAFVSVGAALQAQGKLDAARTAVDENLAICRRLAKQARAMPTGSGTWLRRSFGRAVCCKHRTSWRRHGLHSMKAWRSAGAWRNKTRAMPATCRTSLRR